MCENIHANFPFSFLVFSTNERCKDFFPFFIFVVVLFFAAAACLNYILFSFPFPLILPAYLLIVPVSFVAVKICVFSFST